MGAACVDAWVRTNTLVAFASLKNRRPSQACRGTGQSRHAGAAAHAHEFQAPERRAATSRSRKATAWVATTPFRSSPPFRRRTQDVSYGSSDAEGHIGFMDVPTPGSSQRHDRAGFCLRHQFQSPSWALHRALQSHDQHSDSGHHDSLHDGWQHAGVQPWHGLYRPDFRSAATTVIRAAAFKPEWKPTNVDTQTYLLIDDVVTQTSVNAVSIGFPKRPGQRTGASATA